MLSPLVSTPSERTLFPTEPLAWAVPSDEQDDPLGDLEGRFEPPDAGEDLASFDVTGEELVDELPDPSEAPRDLLETFVVVVVMVNISLFITTLGILLLLVAGWYRVGGGLLAIGLLSGGWAVVRYRSFRRSREQ